MNIANMKPNSQAIMVTETNLPTGIVFKNKHIITNINCWHKFIVHNSGNLPRNVILRAIIDHVHPLDLIPVAYSKDQMMSSFLARNCGTAIQKLCNDNLVVPNPSSGATRPLKLSIMLKFATTTEFKIDVQKNIQSVLHKRYDIAKRTINLTEFHEDPDLTEFCPLSQPRIMFFVLHLTKNLAPFPEKYILTNNRIKLLSALEAVGPSNSIVSLDLSNNLISDMKELQPLKILKIKELILDGNPVCAQYNAESYINEVRKYCNTLQTLDNTPLRSEKFPITRKNFLCDMEGLDLVNQFLEHYYTIYDSKNRRVLEELYHTHAVFSLNSTYIHGQMSSLSTDLRPYNNVSRNLKKISDISRNGDFLYKGRVDIVNLLLGLPLTEHDPYSFQVDLIYHTHRCGIISVTGVFKVIATNLLDSDKIFGFKRVFVIEIVNGDGLCYITNDMFHIYNALTFQSVESFKISKPLSMETTPQPQTNKEHQQVIDTLKIVTNLNSDWAKKCLEESNYDLKKALTLFVDLYKGDKIPKLGFSSVK